MIIIKIYNYYSYISDKFEQLSIINFDKYIPLFILLIKFPFISHKTSLCLITYSKQILFIANLHIIYLSTPKNLRNFNPFFAFIYKFRITQVVFQPNIIFRFPIPRVRINLWYIFSP